MKHLQLSICFLILSMPVLGQNSKPYVSKVWVSDQGDGTYKNPILYSDYSDPDVVKVGSDYYMTSSSFNTAPGLPILHSRDLVNWSLVNHALPKQIPENHFSVPQHGNGVWAPSIRYHNEEVYIYWGDPDFGIYMVKTKDPLATWDDPVLVIPGKGLIDPCPLWDDDGRVYLVHAWAGSRAGVNSLLTVRELNSEGTALIDQGQHVFDGHDQHPTVEGSKFYKRNGYYYIFAPAGGVSTGWQLVLRSKNIYGPYEEKIVLEQGKTKVNGPHQGAWVETDEGESWFFHFQEIDPYGRVVHLQPMQWKDDWPTIGIDQDANGIGEPVESYIKPNITGVHPIVTPKETDEFMADQLGLQWQWQANPDMVWHALFKNTDHLRLFSMNRNDSIPNLWNVPSLLLQKFPAPQFSATTEIKLFPPAEAESGKRAGLLIMGTDYATVYISHDEKGFFVEQSECIDAIGGNLETENERQRLKGNRVYLRVEVTSPNGLCQFSYSENGTRFKKLGKIFRARQGKWIGAKVGLFCESDADAKRYGYADIEFFRVTK